MVSDSRIQVSEPEASLNQRWSPWYLNWEVYLVLIVAAFLRFYHLDSTEFDGDQALVFRMAHDAIAHGLFPATSNYASIRIMNPALVIYVFMIPAALSANPLLGAAFVSLCTTFAAVLTYWFTCRYFGRIAAVVAALLYATGLRSVEYSRFIWQQNLLPPLIILLMASLFRGAVQKRNRWLAPALVLLIGLIVPLHESSSVLLLLVLIAMALAPKTWSWRDLLWAVGILCILYFPYLLWEVSVKFVDVQVLLDLSKHPSKIDHTALDLYRRMLAPYEANLLNPGATKPPDDPRSVVLPFIGILDWASIILNTTLIGGLVTAIGLIFWPGKSRGVQELKGPLKRVRAYWRGIQEQPVRSGLLLIVCWQVLPLVLLTRHSIILYLHYFILFLPGQYILSGFFLQKLLEWVKRWRPAVVISTRVVISLIAAFLVVAQFGGTLGSLVDLSRGYFNDHALLSYPYWSDLGSLQNALNQADQLAQQEHLSRVYVTTDDAIQEAYYYLAEQNQVSTTLFNPSRCMVLPGANQGPAVMLVGPYDHLVQTMLPTYTNSRLIKQIGRRGGPPFSLYLVTAKTQAAPSALGFPGAFQALSSQAQTFTYNGKPMSAVTWQVNGKQQPQVRTIYDYQFNYSYSGASQKQEQSMCQFNRVSPGDQLITAFPAPAQLPKAATLTVGLMNSRDYPYTLNYGPLTMETGRLLNAESDGLKSSQGKPTITFRVG